MKLYHGTNLDFLEIDFKKCKPNKDFGRGFYLTDIRQQAVEMAVRRTKFEEKGSPVVQEYHFDESLLSSNELNVKIFDGISNDWVQFIVANRKARDKKMHDYDIVVGPIADDGVVFQINLFMMQFITIEELVKRLEFKKLNSQYFFGTEKAISKIKKIMKLDNPKIEFIINCDVEEIISLLQEDYGMDMLDAFDTIYNSKIYKKLTDTETGLYVQSPLYIYEYLKEEIAGKSRLFQQGK